MISELDVDLAPVSHIDGLDPAVGRQEADTGRSSCRRTTV